MKIIKYIIIILFACSCGTYPTKEQKEEKAKQDEAARKEMVANLDYGPRPPKDYKKGYMNTIKENLFDPNSAEFRNITNPKSGWFEDVQVGSWKKFIKYGWVICGEVNGKNRYGGYVGYTPAVVIYLNGTYQEFRVDNYTVFNNKERFMSYCGFIPPLKRN